jgi:hypothetical protein
LLACLLACLDPVRAPSFSELSRANFSTNEKKSKIYREYEYFRCVFSFPLHEEKCFSYGMPRNGKKKKRRQLRAQHTKKNQQRSQLTDK